MHYSPLVSKDVYSVPQEAQVAIDSLRKSSLAVPTIQSDNGSSYIAMGFKLVVIEYHLAQKLIRPHAPEQNGIVKSANKTMRESLVSVILTDYEQAKSEISRIIQHYNKERRHSSLNYLTPKQYYRWKPKILLAIREAKIEKAKIIRRENNMLKRNGGETPGTVS